MAGTSKRGLSSSKTRSSGMKGPAGGGRRGTAAKGQAGPQLPGEKKIRRARKAVEVEPPKVRGRGKTPQGPAVDRRTQFVGTDELKR